MIHVKWVALYTAKNADIRNRMVQLGSTALANHPDALAKMPCEQTARWA